MENARIRYLVQRTPQPFRPLTWELLGDRDQAKAHQSFGASTLFCPLSINSRAAFQSSKNTSQSTNTKLWLFSLCLKCLIIEYKKTHWQLYKHKHGETENISGENHSFLILVIHPAGNARAGGGSSLRRLTHSPPLNMPLSPPLRFVEEGIQSGKKGKKLLIQTLIFSESKTIWKLFLCITS